MDFVIKIRNMEPIRVAAIHYAGKVTDAPKYMPEVFKSIRGKISGAPFIGFLSMVDENDEADMLLCVPTQETPSGHGIEIIDFGACRAACLTYTGPYEAMQPAYAAMLRYMKENELTLAPPCREVYIKGPGMIMKGNPNEYITELVYPLED